MRRQGLFFGGLLLGLLLATTAQAGENDEFGGWSRNGWVLRLVDDTTKGGPGDVITTFIDLRDGSHHTHSAQTGSGNGDARRYMGSRWTKKWQPPLPGWRLKMKRTGKLAVTLFLVRGRERVKLGSATLQGRRAPRLRRTRWSPGGVALTVELRGNVYPHFFTFRVPGHAHRWRSPLSQLAPCRRFRRWARCVIRSQEGAKRRALQRWLTSRLKAVQRAPVARRSGLCLGEAVGMLATYTKSTETSICLF